MIQKSGKNRIRKIVIVLLWLCIWQAAVFAVDNEVLLAGPADTVKSLIKEAVLPAFWYTVGVSLLRILGGFLTAFLLGCLLGAAGSKWELCREFLKPFMLFCKAVPVACFAVLLLIWWGAGWLSFAICFLVTLPVIYVNVLEGLKSTDKKLLQMAEVFRLSFLNRFFYIYRPALFSFLQGGLKTALGMGIKAGVAAEVIGLTDHSIGGEIYLSKIYLDTAGVFAWTAVVVALSALLEKGALILWKTFCKWKPVWKNQPAAAKAAAEKKTVLKRYNDKGVRDTAGFALLLENISKSYDGRTVLQQVNKKLESEKIYCIMAPSGAGKTTMLHILAGLTQHDTGRITVLKGKREAENIRVSAVFQEDRLCEDESALLNVELVCGNGELAEQYLEELLGTQNRVQHVFKQPVKTLSGGMKRRVCMARALAAPADVLLLDEPFNGLDEVCMKKTAEWILQHRENRLVVVATHHKEEAEALGGEIWSFDIPKNNGKWG